MSSCHPTISVEVPQGTQSTNLNQCPGPSFLHPPPDSWWKGRRSLHASFPLSNARLHIWCCQKRRQRFKQWKIKIQAVSRLGTFSATSYTFVTIACRHNTETQRAKKDVDKLSCLVGRCRLLVVGGWMSDWTADGTVGQLAAGEVFHNLLGRPAVRHCNVSNRQQKHRLQWQWLLRENNWIQVAF